MLIYWLIYIATLIVSCCFFVLYKDILALMLLLVIAALPFLLLLLHLLSSLLTRVRIEMHNSVVSKAQQSQIVVQIQNRSPVPVINIDIHLTLENQFLQTRQTCRFTVSAPPFSNKKTVFALSSDHVGRVEVKLQKIVFYDFCNLYTSKLAKLLKGFFSYTHLCIHSQTFGILEDCIDLSYPYVLL